MRKPTNTDDILAGLDVTGKIAPRFNVFAASTSHHLFTLVNSPSGIGHAELADMVQSAIDKTLMHVSAAINRESRNQKWKTPVFEPVRAAIDEMAGESFGWER